ncbi:MAG: AAA family ATPase [Thermotogae bacterium]|jgi:lon-related putative ATP-dependent protease|nr:AAA family ATPase [Thermotogota bacterium]MCL5031797.1 AAA family ATPase [Thermotogota bacterium]
MKELKANEIEIDLSNLNLPKSTKDVKIKVKFDHQSRAYEALKDAVKLDNKNYNIFVAGPTGSGRHTFVRDFLSQIVSEMPAPKDWAYVYNFSNAFAPRALSFEPGNAQRFKDAMSKMKKEVLESIKRAFESNDYAKRKSDLEGKYASKRKELWDSLSKKSSELGFTVQVGPTGIMTIPVLNGKPLSQEEFDRLNPDQKKFYEENVIKLKKLVDGTLHKSRVLENEFKDKMDKLDEEIAKFAIDPIFDELDETFKENFDVVDFLKSVKKDILDNLEVLRNDQTDKDKFMSRYDINVVIDNSKVHGAPVVEELNPTYANLFGKVEYYATMGTLQTDFKFIRSGAFHRANGGFMILNAEDLFRSELSWDATKRLINSGTLKIENIQEYLGYGITVTLNPEPIPADVKIIMVGEPWIYDLLYQYDADFRKFFKIKAPFDWEIDLSSDGVEYYLQLLRSVIDKRNLLHVDESGIKEIIRTGMRLIERRTKISTQANKIAAILVESDHKARELKKKKIDAQSVKEALKAMELRLSLEADRMLEYFKNNEIMIDTTGEKVGQVNGLTVIEGGDYPFGMPVRITAKTHLSDTGVIDIQRESNMSGKIFTKAVLIISNYLSAKYTTKHPLSFAATVSFEQTYSTIEGDSASVAETLSIISAISKVPLKQSLAITGSINQNGEVQPVGGIPYKIEGFFKVCKIKGLTGDQGVIIPASNVDDLVLDPEIIESVKAGKFHIWTVRNVDEALEIATGKKAGTMDGKMDYEKGSINYLVLKEIERISKMEEKSEKKRTNERKSTKKPRNTESQDFIDDEDEEDDED